MKLNANPKTRLILKATAVAFPLFLLAACGGGGGSDSGGGSSSSEYDGVYKGSRTRTATFSHGQVAPKTDTRDITITVKSNTVELDSPDFGDSIVSSFNGSKFTIRVDFFTSSCSTAVNTYRGSISNGKITGTIDGTASCTDSVGPYTTTMKGTFNVKK